MEGFLICKNCNTRYDVDKKKPIVMPCGHSCCKECYLSSTEPQENKVKCPFEDKTFDIPSELPINYIVLELLGSTSINTRGPQIFCHEHEHKDVEFYCRTHNELLCSLCVWEHSDHRALVKVCTQKEVKAHTELLRTSLESMHKSIVEKIEQGKQTLYQIENKEKQMSSKEIMDGFNLVKQILIKPFYDEEGEGKKIKYIIEIKDSLLQGSSLVKSNEELAMIKKWTGKNYLVTELIYRATKDGFTGSTFHSKCDNQGPTITVIKSKSNQIFGGYNPASWTSDSSYSTNSGSFLFHVTKKQKLEQITTANAWYNYSSYGPTWGGGHDLHICDQANTLNGSYVNLGSTYKVPDGHSYGSNEAKNYFAGSYNFMVDEIEVHKVVVSE